MPRADLFGEVDAEWTAAADEALDVFVRLGAEVEEVTLPNILDLLHVGFLLLSAECAAFHADKFRVDPDAFGPMARSLIETGQTFTAVQYIQAQRVRRKVSEEILGAFDRYDAFVLPTTLLPACPIEDDSPSLTAPRLRNTFPFNCLGVPALSVPCGFDRKGMPIGLQIAAAPFAEDRLLSLAYAYEQETRWYERHPPP